MIAVKDLKKFVMLGYLSEEMLTSLIPITEILNFDEDEMIFKQGEKANRLYFVKRGKVLLEHKVTDTLTISMSSVEPGFSFGWSSMLENDVYSSNAICAEPCQVYTYRDHKLKELMNEDHSIGFVISQRLLYVLKKRFDVRTSQLIKMIKFHPDISNLL
ncbi:MAG: cyclic nucleotide-binding domain-containing protein [Desulfobacteraceae bacterium]|nr:cyclic nucleotide-binding domain-containing protein [Desulfobacteraceae bacterium]